MICILEENKDDYESLPMLPPNYLLLPIGSTFMKTTAKYYINEDFSCSLFQIFLLFDDNGQLPVSLKY